MGMQLKVSLQLPLPSDPSPQPSSCLTLWLQREISCAYVNSSLCPPRLKNQQERMMAYNTLCPTVCSFRLPIFSGDHSISARENCCTVSLNMQIYWYRFLLVSILVISNLLQTLLRWVTMHIHHFANDGSLGVALLARGHVHLLCWVMLPCCPPGVALQCLPTSTPESGSCGVHRLICRSAYRFEN